MTDIGKVTPIEEGAKPAEGVDALKPLNLELKKSVFGTPQVERNFEANLPKLCFFTFVIGLGNIQAGFAISGNN
jgi:hypothetical protein